MAANKTQLTGADILDKDFKTAFRGYKQEEVDEFLDIVIRDYETMQQTINQLKQENERLKQEPDSRREQAPQQKAPPQNQQVNYDVLKRVSNLEKAVFGGQNKDS